MKNNFWQYAPDFITKTYLDYLNGADIFENCEFISDKKAEMTNIMKDDHCVFRNNIKNDFADTHCPVTSNTLIEEELIEYGKLLSANLERLSETTEKLFEETKTLKNNMNWQMICLYITWVMLLVIGIMIYCKSFDMIIDVENSHPRQEIYVKRSK